MHVLVRSAQIAQGLAHPVSLRFEDEPLMVPARDLAKRDGEAQLERHVEPRRVGRRRVEFDARQIVE